CEGYQKLIDEHLKSLGRYVVFNPSASTPSKIWPAEYFAQVASDLFKKYDVIPVIIGGKEDAQYSDAMKKYMNGIAIDFTGKLGIGALAWLLKKALLFISNDTGPVHVAASLGTPVISIFLRNVPGLGPTRWQPLGAKTRYLLEEIVMTPDMANHATIERAQIRTLTPEAIEKIVEEEGWLSRDKVQL
ncbi:MAG: glycosyltransferase family 9 protein, partial [Candidatus Omnitrophica bacterium]|nr:glycosyltransferase family 9 protein [Candidatus Omnitrophota bacterium]